MEFEPTGPASIGIRPLTLEDAEALLDLRLRNREHFSRFEPRRPDPDDGYTQASIRDLILSDEKMRAASLAYGFGVFAGGDLVGRVALSNVVRAAWLSCTLGYYVDEAASGRGYATEGVRQVVRFAFERAGLHRVQAAVMPRNAASVRVLEKAGFRHEGFAQRYLQIDGVWEDHELFAITAD